MFKLGEDLVHVEALELPSSAEFGPLARRLSEQADRLVVQLAGRLRAALPVSTEEPLFSEEEILAFARESLREQLQCFSQDRLPGRCAAADAAAARAAARLGALQFLLNAYRVFQGGLWGVWLELVEATPAQGEPRDELLRHGCRFLSIYCEHVRDLVIDVYQHELERLARSGEGRRLHAVSAVLEGEAQPAAMLELDIERHHLGLIASAGPGEQAARRLAAALERPLLLLNSMDGRCWGWISGARPLSAAQARIVQRFAPAEGARLAIGLEGFGEAGFRASNRQALRAWRVAPEAAVGLIRYADVAVEALASENVADARAFLTRELQGIDDDTSASQKIRETIAAYFAAEHNAASAAAALGIHQQTVANRLRAAEERLGHPVGARRLELQTALRLRTVLERADP